MDLGKGVSSGRYHRAMGTGTGRRLARLRCEKEEMKWTKRLRGSVRVAASP